MAPPFATTKEFWFDFIAFGLIGCIMGVLGFCFVSAFEHFTDWWYTDFDQNSYPDSSTWDYGDGQWYWPLMSMGSGLLVGIGRLVLRFPKEYPGFLDEIAHAHADVWLSFRVAFLGLLSLLGGLTVGPEAPLGSLGAGVGQLFADKVGRLWGMDSKMAVYAGMTGAMCVLFPSPMFGVLMIVELGIYTWKPDDLYKQVACTTMAGCCSFVVYIALAESGLTYLSAASGTSAAGIVMGWDLIYLLYAVPLGLYAGLVGLVGMGIFKAVEFVTKLIKTKLLGEEDPPMGPRKIAIELLFPVLIGAISGGINVAAPLSIGDGSAQLNSVISDGTTMGVGILIGNALLKLVCLGLAQGAGFVGGFFFPMFYVGTTAGVLIHMAFPPDKYDQCISVSNAKFQYLLSEYTNSTGTFCISRDDNGTGINLYFAALALMVAVPGAVVPFPFTLTCIAGFSMEMTSYQMSAIWITVMVSYTLVSGTLMGLRGGTKEGADEDEIAEACAQQETDEPVVTAQV